MVLEDLIQTIKAPDFPTGGIIYGYDGVREAFLTGRCRVVLRGKANIEEINGCHIKPEQSKISNAEQGSTYRLIIVSAI